MKCSYFYSNSAIHFLFTKQVEQLEFPYQIKKDHLVDQCDLTGTERFTNLFQRYMKYLFLESTIALISCSCKVSHKPNERLKKEPFEFSESVLNTLHLLNCKKLVVKFFVRNTSASDIWCFRHQFRIYTFSKIRLCF